MPIQYVFKFIMYSLTVNSFLLFIFINMCRNSKLSSFSSAFVLNVRKFNIKVEVIIVIPMSASV